MSSSFWVGAIEVVALHDGHGLENARDGWHREGVADPWAGHEDEIDANGDLRLSLGGYMLRVADRVVLLDAGVGTIDNGRYRGGGLLTSLRDRGVAPEEVTDVAFTHLHFDHVGWATQKGTVVFPRATYHAHAADWEHFVAGPAAPQGSVRKLSPLADRLSTFNDEVALAPGLVARPAPGHTPGSTVFVISDGPESAIVIGDVAHTIVELLEPGWSFAFDDDPTQATRTRQDLVAQVLDTGTLIAGGHFPGMRPGRLISRQGVIYWQAIEE